MISRSRNSSTPAGQVLANGRRRQGRGEGRSLFGSGRTSISSFALRVASRCAALGRTIQEHPDRELQPLHDIEWPQDLSTPRIEQHQPRSGSEGCLGPAGFTSNLHLQRAFMELLHAAGARKKWAAPVADGASAGHLMGTCCMGNALRNSVVDKYHRVHDVANLFIVDGSSFATSALTHLPS